MEFDTKTRKKDITLNINRKAVYSLLGYKKGITKLFSKSSKLVESSLEKSYEYISPDGIFLLRLIEKHNRVIYLKNSEIKLIGKSMSDLLTNSYAVILMAVTIGYKIDTIISEEVHSGNYENAFIYDVIGSEAAEATAVSLYTFLTSLVRQEKLTLTKRFSPGYGDFSLENQKFLFQELSLRDLNMKINDKHILSPRKSITAVIGVEK